jgi:hypothetical protein
MSRHDEISREIERLLQEDSSLNNDCEHWLKVANDTCTQKCPDKHGENSESQPIWTLEMEKDLQRSIQDKQQEKNQAESREHTRHYIDGPAIAMMPVGIPKRNADGTITWEDSPATVHVGADNLRSRTVQFSPAA